MRTLVIASALAIGGSAVPLAAQTTLDYPVGQFELYPRDSGVRANLGNTPQTVYVEMVRIEGAAWLRIYFAMVELAPGSTVRMTSMLDGEVQELDADGLMMWQDTSAYFNGDTVMVELIAAPKSKRNRMVIDQVSRTMAAQAVGGCTFPCGICGADDRLPSNENWSGRLLPVGCTASVWNEASCLVSAGHCITGGLTVQFNVPDSNPNCSTNNPPIADQFPVLATSFTNGGVGNDWSVLTTGTNNLGQTIFERYGELRPIATTPPAVGQALDVWGFGIDDQCTLSQTQQTSGGAVGTVSGSFFDHTVDITCGSSGSAIIRNGEILGIVTHCPCPGIATRVDLASFAAARDALCRPFLPNCGDGQVDPGENCSNCPQDVQCPPGENCVGGVCQGGNPACPGAGDCCAANGSPGCSNETCCNIICACDPFCCDTTWDEFCAGQGFGGSGCGAELLCGLCGGGGTNNTCDNADPISDGTTAFDTTGTTTDGPPLPAACDEGFGLAFVNDIWFAYTASCTGTVTVSTCNAASFDTRLAAYLGTGCPPATLVGCNDDGAGCAGFTSQMTFSATQGQSYLLRVGSFDTSGTGTLTVSCASLCGNGVADPGENCLNCPQDIQCPPLFECVGGVCQPLCGNGVADPGENCSTCPQDIQCPPGFECVGGVCQPLCGNGVVDPGEDCANCPQDVECPPGTECIGGVCVDLCGNGVVDPGEDCSTCPADVSCPPGEACVGGVCEPLCGNGVADPGEDCSTCPQDITCPPGTACVGGVCVADCPQDVNGDGNINVLDLIDLLLCFGNPAVPGCEAEDVNGGGTVNVLDLIDLLLLFGTTCP